MTDLPRAIGCRPVDPQQYPGPRRSMWNGLIAQGLTEPPIYPGSTYGRCQECAIDIVIGPRQQEALELAEQLQVQVDCYCLVCASLAARQQDMGVRSLGNPFLPSA